MPELPEVEIIKSGLQKRIIGSKLTKIQILSAKSFIGNPDLAEGQKVLKVWRRAKILGIDLSSEDRHPFDFAQGKLPRDDKGATLLFHLKMSGQLIYVSDDKRFIGGHPTEDMAGDMPNKHTRVIFSFSDQSHLFFNDQRKFGWIKVTGNQELRIMNQGKGMLANLGPEPLEKGFSWNILKSNLLKHKSQPVKIAIMDQNAVSGIGNIYANEACFLAKIHPAARISNLSDEQFKNLHQGIIAALREGIKHGGSSLAHFVDTKGQKGYFLDYAFVYGLDNHPCKICKTMIKKIQLGGRGTYFCPVCQTLV